MDYEHYTKSELIDMLVTLEREFAQLRTAMEALPRADDLRKSLREDPYALLEPFIDDEEDCLLLVNMSYRIAYLNPAAAGMLQIHTPQTYYGRNVFDLMKLKQALKLKEIIDQAYVSGKKGRLKELKLIKAAGGSLKVRVSSRRVRFNEDPAVQLRLKPA